MTVRIQWIKVRQGLKEADSTSRWKKVAGPLAATIACLCKIGWNPHAPDIWYDRDGTKWSMDHLSPQRIPIKNTLLAHAVDKGALRMIESTTAKYADRSIE